MHAANTEWIDHIFHPEPATWGLRGDPYLWRDLREALRNEIPPRSETALEALLNATVQRLLTDAPVHGESVYVERFAHGGMSSGRVCLRFWRDTALPLLCRRFSESVR
jgi:hypothetical protein